MREFELKSDYKQTCALVMVSEVEQRDCELYYSSKKQMFSRLDSSPEVIRDLNMNEYEAVHQSMILVSFNQASTQSVTLTRYIFLQEDNDWVQEITRKVAVP